MQLGHGQNEKYVQLISTNYILCANIWSGLDWAEHTKYHPS